MTKTKPVHSEKLGLVIANVWSNPTEKGTRFNVTLERVYRSGEKWQSTTSLGRDDLPLAIKVLDNAHSWIFEQKSK